MELFFKEVTQIVREQKSGINHLRIMFDPCELTFKANLLLLNGKEYKWHSAGITQEEAAFYLGRD